MELKDINTVIIGDKDFTINYNTEDLINIYHGYDKNNAQVVEIEFSFPWDKMQNEARYDSNGDGNIDSNDVSALQKDANVKLFYYNIEEFSNKVYNTELPLSSNTLDLTNQVDLYYNIDTYTTDTINSIKVSTITGKDYFDGGAPSNYRDKVFVDGLYIIELTVDLLTNGVTSNKTYTIASLIIPNLNKVVLEHMKKPYSPLQYMEGRVPEWAKIQQKIESIKIELELGNIEEATRIFSSLTYKTK